MLNRAIADLGKLNQDHQSVLEQFRKQIAESEQRALWAQQLGRDLEERGARIVQLQEEFAAEQAAARAMAEAYETALQELESENQAKTRWALETEARLSKELDAKCQELAQCVEILHEAERTIEARTAWAGKLQTEAYRLEQQLNLMKESRWFKVGRKLGMGPEMRNS